MYEKLGVLAIYRWKRLQKRHLPPLQLCTTRAQKCAGVSGWSKAQTNVIGALCGTAPFAFTAFDCSIDSDVFHTWATEILLPELPACSVIVMDNASFHKRQDTLDALQAEGHTVLWRPPYSPDLNPIEKTWHGPSSWGKNGGWLMWIPCCFDSLLSLLFDYKEHFPLFYFATHRIVIHK